MVLDRYEPTPHDQVEAILNASRLTSGERLLDIGSGDGRILIAAGRRGAQAVGYDLDAELVRKSRDRAEQPDTRHGDALDVPWAAYDVIVWTGEQGHDVIRAKFAAEKRDGARLVFWDGHSADVVR